MNIRFDRLTKRVIAALVMFLLAYFITPARATEEADVTEIAVICTAASQVILSIYDEGENSDEYRSVLSQTTWWYNFLVAWTQQDVEIITTAVEARANHLIAGINGDETEASANALGELYDACTRTALDFADSAEEE